jgi:hypothetical protein
MPGWLQPTGWPSYYPSWIPMNWTSGPWIDGLRNHGIGSGRAGFHLLAGRLDAQYWGCRAGCGCVCSGCLACIVDAMRQGLKRSAVNQMLLFAEAAASRQRNCVATASKIMCYTCVCCNLCHAAPRKQQTRQDALERRRSHSSSSSSAASTCDRVLEGTGSYLPQLYQCSTRQLCLRHRHRGIKVN